MLMETLYDWYRKGAWMWWDPYWITLEESRWTAEARSPTASEETEMMRSGTSQRFQR